MADEKKYEILPGVDIPDMKTIKERYLKGLREQ